jgi:hypothetical protein
MPHFCNIWTGQEMKFHFTDIGGVPTSKFKLGVMAGIEEILRWKVI